MPGLQTRMTKSIPYPEFVKELAEDLPQIVQQDGFPNISYLVEYYGETTARVKAACRELEHRGKVVIKRAVNNAYIIVPVSELVEVSPLLLLTPLQKDLLILFARLCQHRKTDTVVTNYSQLARVVKCSYGGLRICVTRLVELKYIEILTTAVRGKQDSMTIRITPKLKEVYDAFSASPSSNR